MRLRTGHRLTLVTLTCLSLLGSLPSIAAPSVQAGFSPEGSAEQLVLKTIETAQHNIRLMGYSFTSPEVVRALISAKRRGVDVKVVLDEKGNRGKVSMAAMNLLVNAGIPVRTVSKFKILHDKVIVTDGVNVETGSFKKNIIIIDLLHDRIPKTRWLSGTYRNWPERTCSTGSPAGMWVKTGGQHTDPRTQKTIVTWFVRQHKPRSQFSSR